MLRSIRVRLTLWYVVMLAAILAAFSAGVYLALRANLYSNLNDSLDSKAAAIGAAVQDGGGRPQLTPDAAPPDPDGEQFVRLFDASGALVFDNSTVEAGVLPDSAAVTAAAEGATDRRTESVSGDAVRILTVPVYRDGSVFAIAQVGKSEGDVHDTLRTLQLIIAAAYPLTLGLASAGGVFLAGRALGPIGRVTTMARRLSAEDLNQRIEADLPDDEVGRLVTTFNEMIARLDAAFRRQRQFTADASHELRTPLTAIKGQTEVALQQERSAEGYRDVLRAVNSQADRMIRLVGSLLTLARADSGGAALTLEQVDLGKLLADAADQIASATAAAKQIEVRVSGGPEVHLSADEDLLLQLVLNLLDNAVKYSPPGASVTISWAAEDGDAVVRVSDTGPGIAPEHLKHIFDRFYRVEESRASETAGFGLGLSISRWIAEAHGGTLAAESLPGSGSTFTLRIPLERRSDSS